MKRLSIVVLLVLFAGLSALASAETLRAQFMLSGTEVGENVFEMQADGRFTSRSTLDLVGQKVVSTLTGQFDGEKLLSFDLDQTRAGRQFKIVYAGGKVAITVGGKTSETGVKFEKGVLLATFHPQMFRTLLDVMAGKTGPQSVPLFLMEGGIARNGTVSSMPRRTVKKDGANVSALEYSVKIGPQEMLAVVDDEKRVLGYNVAAQSFQCTLAGYAEVFVDPTARYPELSQPAFKPRHEKGVKIKMRDGVELAADVFVPEGSGRFPTILVRTPYGRTGSALEGGWWAQRGYAYIAQDCRGRHDSGGEWSPFANERKDGYDTLDWIAKQPWSDGKVGMIGASYGGYVQWAAAVERHPALKCIVPQVSPPDLFYNIPYDHGIFFLYGNLWWSNIVKNKAADMTLVGRPMPNIEKLTTLPLSKLDQAILGRPIPFFQAWLEQDRPSAFAEANYAADMPKVTIPALHISGWWDGDGIGTKRNWQIMRAAKRTNQWLLYGPWSHAFNTSSKFADVDYGSGAILELQSLYLRWFDTWLKGKEVGLAKMPKVRAFVTGANEWRDLRDWPDPRLPEKALYLGADSPANGPTSGGKLLDTPPAQSEPDRYTYNPASVKVAEEFKKPNPDEATTVIKLKEKEDDQLLFKTEPLSNAMEIGGPIRLDLTFSTSAKDTDFFVLLVDVDPKGAMHLIGLPGKINGKFVGGWKEPRLLTPGRVYRAQIDLWDTAHRFAPGHRIGLLIASEMFPQYARNLNTGEPIKDAVRMVAAHQTIYHDRAHPSVLRFRLLPTK